jgi:hypothetical protein
LVALVAVSTLGCVETAECDATVPCEEGDRCYDYECHPICEVDSDCGRGAICVPCMQDDAEGTIDHCFEATESVCVLEE